MKKKIAIAILNWNGKELLEQFIPSVVRYSNEATIYVIDNASTDQSVDFLKDAFPEINIIQNSGNFGFAKGYNAGLEQIDEELLCLLNSDVEVTENWLKPILELFDENEELGIVQPKILDYRHPDLFEYAGAAGGFIDKYGYPYCRGRLFNTLEKDDGQYDDTVPIFWASGACFFIRNQVFKSLGGFDESYFAHMEEIDLCWRCQMNGQQIVYTPKSKVFHVGGATLNKTNPKKTFLNFRNSLYTLIKNAQGPLLPLLFTRLLLDGIAGLHFLFKLKPKDCFAIVKAHLVVYRNFSRLLKDRKHFPKKIKHYTVKSIAWHYFVLKNRIFSRL